jgi:twitching motility protein PilT
MTIEDPIEYIHTNKKSIISQREVDRDTLSMSRAISSAVTEDMDVIMIGELIDEETAEKALEAAISGHLVLTSISSISALDTLVKMIEWFPPHKQNWVKARLSPCLKGIIHQNLVHHAEGNGMAMAVEILVQTPAVSVLIREDKLHQIYSLMQSQGSTGMVTLNQSLAELVSNNVVTKEMALDATLSKNELLDILSRS